MDASRWEQVEALFAAASERPRESWPAFVAESCGEDTELQALVMSMLLEDAEDPGFLEEPVARVTEMASGQGSAAPAGDVDPVGEHARFVGPYRLVRELGSGGMGHVYLAVHEGEGFSRSVAVKVIRPGLDSDDVLRRFGLERKILAELNHPNIASLLDGGVTEEGRSYLVMEFVEGVPIDEYCDQKNLSVDERLALIGQVCEGVQHAHQNLVLHRDLKPANILVSDQGAVKLLDFGVAKLVDPEGSDSPLTRVEARMITPEYAAPEQLAGRRVSVATDVYSLGALAYELLAGRRPWDRGDGERAAISEGDVRPPSVAYRTLSDQARRSVAAQRRTSEGQLHRTLRGDLANILLKSLRAEPERRYPSVAALADDLYRYGAGLPVRARPSTLGYRLGKLVRRQALPLAATAAVILTLAGATLTSVLQSRRIASERDKALEVRGFLLEMFGATGPGGDAASAVTARELLDQQSEALASTYRADPLLRAEMMLVLAEGYDRIGALAEADSLAASGLALRQEELGPIHPESGAAMSLLGWIRHESGHSEEGERLLSEAIEILESGPQDPRRLSRAYNDFGVVREAAGDYDEAEAAYLRALDLRREAFGPGHRAFAVTASNLSVIRYRRGELAGAVAAATEALDGMREAVGPDHQRSLLIQSNLAAMQVARGDDRGAIEIYTDLLERQTRLQGESHSQTITVMAGLGRVLANAGQWPEAERYTRRALELQTERLGAANPQNGILLTRLARIQAGLRDYDQAVASAQAALDLFTPVLDPDHPLMAEALESLANGLEPSDPVRAEELHRDAIARLERQFGEDHLEPALARTTLGDRLRVRGRDADALFEYRTAHDALRAAVQPDHHLVQRTRVRLAEMLVRTGDYASADSVLVAAERAPESGAGDPFIGVLADSVRALIASGSRRVP